MDFLDSCHWILALPVAEETFTFILGMFVISNGIESLSTVAVAIGTLGWVVARTIASRDLVWALVLFSFCRDSLQREEEVRGRLAGKGDGEG